MVNGYKDLFQPDGEDALQAEYEAIVGDSFDVVDPSMQQLFDGANQEVNEAAQNICGDLTKGSLSLDKAILACVFHFIEEFCPKEEADDNLIINLKTLRWRLDDVVFDWGASPPPPPPVKHGAYEDLIAADPEGMEIAREKILEFWPEMKYVAQQTSGANVGRDHSADGLGYGPVYYVSKYSMSTAYLSTAHFKDQDALSARIIQARFTGHFRFACQAFLEFMSDPTTSGAGSNNPEVSAFGNPDDFASPYDRNWLAMASALFSESYFSETGHHYDTGVHKFWQENCEAPAVERGLGGVGVGARRELDDGVAAAQPHRRVDGQVHAGDVAEVAEDLAQVRGRDLAREIRDPEDVEAGHGRPGPRSLRFASVQEVCVWSCLQGEELVR